MSEAMQQIVESCPSCGQPIDVTGQAPFSEVSCPACGAKMRARIQFNHFTLLELLGEGGMGWVFKALDANLQRKVALKILKLSAATTEADWEKLASEARLTAAVNHPNVVKVFSFGEDHGQFYLAMELVEKGSLDSLMTLQTKLAEVHVLDIGIQAAEGLRAAYEVGLIHRDIKPGNLLFATPKLAKLVDFGLARVLDEDSQESGEIWGTPFYVAPEKLDGRPEDFRSDIYSLGGTLFHALAGRPPFDAKTASMVVLKHIKSQAVSLQAFAPGISDETAYVINRMLHKDPEKRYASYEELLTHLNYARQRLQQRQSELGGKTEKRARAPIHGVRLPLTLVWGAAVVLCAAVTFGLFRLTPVKTTAASTSAPADEALFVQGRAALNARNFSTAQESFTAAVTAAAGRQPIQNWATAQLGLAAMLGGNEEQAHSAFEALVHDGIYNPGLSAQPQGRLFADLGRGMAAGDVIPTEAAAAFENEDVESFALLAFGLRNWTAGDVSSGGEMLRRFAESRQQPPCRWIADLQPLVVPYLNEYRRYLTLQEDVRKAGKAGAANLLVQIEQAKSDVKTGPPMVQQLDALAQKLPLE